MVVPTTAQRRFVVRDFRRTLSRGHLTEGRLLAGMPSLTDPTASGFSLSRLGSRVSTLTGRELAANEADVVSIGNLRVLGVMGGATLFIPDTPSGVSKTGSTTDFSLTVTNDQQCRHSYFNLPYDGAVCLRCVIDTTASDAAFAGVGHFDGATSKWLAVNIATKAVSVVGFTRYGSKDLGDGRVFIWASADVAAADAGFEAKFAVGDSATFTGGTVGTVATFEDVNITRTTSPMALFPAGSAAGATYGADVPTVTGIDWSLYRGLLTFAIPYGADGSDSPNALDSLFWENTNLIHDTPGDASLTGSGGAPVIASGVEALADIAFSSVADWTGAEIGLVVNGGARASAVESDTPTGDIVIGNGAAGLKAGQMALAVCAIPNDYTGAQAEAVRAYGHSQLSAWLSRGGFVS